MSALSAVFLLLSTPIFSTISVVSLIPAVSIKLIATPFKVIVPSTISLVVPGISVTIAFSSSSKLFKILLLPTFGLPIIATFTPSLISLPFLAPLTKTFNSLVISSRYSCIKFSVTSSSSVYSG